MIRSACSIYCLSQNNLSKHLSKEHEKCTRSPVVRFVGVSISTIRRCSHDWERSMNINNAFSREHLKRVLVDVRTYRKSTGDRAKGWAARLVAQEGN